jgi:hypothetical protein
VTVVADPPISVRSLMGAIDHGAREAANDVRRTVLGPVRATLPARSGRARRGTTGRVGRTPTGYSVTFAATSRVRYPNGVSAKQVVRWLHTGTGVFGPLGRPIKPKKGDAFHLPSGWRSGTLRGYPGRDFFGHAQRALGGTVYRTFEDGADRAARWAEAAIR